MIREKIANNIFQGFYGSYPFPKDWGRESEQCLKAAGRILSLITTEIEKVGNPYMPIRSGTSDADRNSTFESCRQAILNLLKEQK